MVDFSVGLLPVDVLENIKAWHPFPARQGAPFTFLKGFLGKDMVLNKEHPRLQNMRFDGRSMEIVKTIEYSKCKI